MPELPEVETVRRDLAPLVSGRRIQRFIVFEGGERVLVGAPKDYVRSRLEGMQIGELGRRGKYLVLPLVEARSGAGEGSLVLHLRMTGSLKHRRADHEADRFERARIELDDGTALRFCDVRKFGTFEIIDDVDTYFSEKLGAEPLTAAFTLDALWSALRGRQSALKSALLDQSNVAGLGNIYVDEALFLARLHPSVPAGSLRPAERAALHEAIEQTLREGIEHRGASFRDYRDGKGEEGSQQFFVRVFRRTDQPCDTCGSTIRRSVVGGRSSHWCPSCQPVGQTRRKVNSSRRG
jgi:formamidopyrimidine-DNA glycosylase